MLNWDNLRVFLTAVRAGSYSGAASQLKIDRTTVGRRLEKLEHQLSSTLFEQDENGYHPTREGRLVLEAALAMSNIADDLVAELGHKAEQSSQVLRVAVASDLGPELTASLISSMTDEDNARLSIISTPDAAAYVLQRRCDVALCLADERPKHLRGPKIATLRQTGYASKAYLDRVGRGKAPQAYDWVRYSSWSQLPAMRRWDQIICDYVSVAAQVEDWNTLRAAIENGLGAGFLWTFFGDAQPGLERIAPPRPEIEIDLWLAARDDIPPSKLIRALFHRLPEVLGEKEANLSG